MRVAIVGAHRNTKGLAPFADPAWSIWSCSPSNADAAEIPRVDAWFEMHENGSGYRSNEQYRKWLELQPVVYMTEHDPSIPGSTVYPKTEILEEFGPYFFTCSIAYMQALAISRNPQEIGIWGVEGRDDRGHQRPGILHFVQTARDRGIKVTTPPQSRLLDAMKHYG